MAATIADASFSFFFNLLSTFDLGKGWWGIYGKNDGLFVATVFYPVGDSRLMPEDIPFSQVINFLSNRILYFTLNYNFDFFSLVLVKFGIRPWLSLNQNAG